MRAASGRLESMVDHPPVAFPASTRHPDFLPPDSQFHRVAAPCVRPAPLLIPLGSAVRLCFTDALPRRAGAALCQLAPPCRRCRSFQRIKLPGCLPSVGGRWLLFIGSRISPRVACFARLLPTVGRPSAVGFGWCSSHLGYFHGAYTPDLNPMRTAPLRGTHKPVGQSATTDRLTREGTAIKVECASTSPPVADEPPLRSPT